MPALRPCPAPVVPRVLGGYVPLPRRPPHVASPHVLVGLVVEPLHDGSATRPPPLHRPTSPPSTSGPADFRFRRPRIRGHTLPPHTHPPTFPAPAPLAAACVAARGRCRIAVPPPPIRGASGRGRPGRWGAGGLCATLDPSLAGRAGRVPWLCPRPGSGRVSSGGRVKRALVPCSPFLA